MILSGTPNIAAAVWDAGNSRYEITLVAETFVVGSYSTVVTPSSLSPVIATTGSIGGTCSCTSTTPPASRSRLPSALSPTSPDAAPILLIAPGGAVPSCFLEGSSQLC